MDIFSDLDDIDFSFSSISPAWDENYDLFSIHDFSPLFHQTPASTSSALDGDIPLDEQEDLTINRSSSLPLPQQSESQKEGVELNPPPAEQPPLTDSVLDGEITLDEQEDLTINSGPSLQFPQQHEGQREGVELNPPPQQQPLTSSAPSNRLKTYIADPDAPVNQDARMIQATQHPEWRAVFHLVGPNVRTFSTSCSSGLKGKKRGRPAKNANPNQSTEWRGVFDLVVLDTITFTTSSSSGLSVRDEAPASLVLSSSLIRVDQCQTSFKSMLQPAGPPEFEDGVNH